MWEKADMAAHAPAQTDEIETLAAEGVAELRESKRGRGEKLSLQDPREINREIVFALARKVPASRIADKIDELIEMKRQTKDGVVTDVRAMEAGIKLYLAYVVGMPTQRQEIVSVSLDADSSIGLAQRLANSPALLKSLKEVITKVEATEIVPK
jgi:hypothetical protein